MQKRPQKIAACIHCRQMKLRCDGHLTFPAPCSRCEMSKLHCSVDPLFRRTAKRERLDVVERELREIKQKLGAPPDPAAQNPSQPPGRGSLTISADTTFLPNPPAHPTLLSAHFVWQDIRTNLSSRMLGNTELQPHLIGDLVEEYYSRYHDSLPILPHIAKFMEHVDQCPLLFWVVMVIALRNKPKHWNLYLALSKSVQIMAFDIAIPESRSLCSIQALLLLCCWPLPFGPTKNDPSHTFISLATHNALRLGLHRPKHPSDFEYEIAHDDDMTVLRRKCWVACFIINQNVSAHLGVPALIRLDQSLLEAIASKPPWLPDTLYYQLHTARQGYRICDVLGNHEMTSTGLLPDPAPNLRMFDDELRLQQTRFSQAWDKKEFINFLECKLLLCAFALSADGLSLDGDALHKESSSHWLAQSYLTATTLLETALSIRADIPFVTIHLRRCLITAVFFLVRLTGHHQLRFVDEIQSRNSINQGWDMLKSCSVVENDHISRTCAVIEYLSNGDDTQGQLRNQYTFSIRSRMGANLLVDSVFRARDRFSQSVKDQKPSDYTEAAAHEQLEAHLGNGFPGHVWSPQNDAANVDWNTFFENL